MMDVLSPKSIEKTTDQQRADLHRMMTAYSGTYTFDGSKVVHRLDISWNEVWAGTTNIRDVQRDGDRVIFTPSCAVCKRWQDQRSDSCLEEIELVQIVWALLAGVTERKTVTNWSTTPQGGLSVRFWPFLTTS